MVRGRKNPLHFGLASRLKRARQQSGLKRLPLADKAGVVTATERLIESGQQLPTVGTIARLASALAVSAAWLGFGLGDMPAEGTVTCDNMGTRLQAARVEQGHTKASLARLTTLNPGTIGGIENGGQAGVQTVEVLAKALAVSPAWLAFALGPRELPKRRRAARLQKPTTSNFDD